MNPLTFMYEKDASKREAMLMIARASREMRERDADQLAVRIANKVGELLGGR